MLVQEHQWTEHTTRSCNSNFTLLAICSFQILFNVHSSSPKRQPENLRRRVVKNDRRVLSGDAKMSWGVRLTQGVHTVSRTAGYTQLVKSYRAQKECNCHDALSAWCSKVVGTFRGFHAVMWRECRWHWHCYLCSVISRCYFILYGTHLERT